MTGPVRALGLATWPLPPLPAPLGARRIGRRLALLWLDAGGAAPSRSARLACLCRLARTLPAFLPLNAAPLRTEALIGPLLARQSLFEEALGRVRGASELLLTVEDRAPSAASAPHAAAGPGGREWLRGRLALLQAVESREARLRGLLESVRCGPPDGVRDRRILPFPLPGGAGADLALLVDRAAAPALLARLRAWRPALPEIGARATGPWPCFAFAPGPDAMEQAA